MLEHADALWTKQQISEGVAPSLRLKPGSGKAGKVAPHFGTSDASPL